MAPQFKLLFLHHAGIMPPGCVLVTCSISAARCLGPLDLIFLDGVTRMGRLFGGEKRCSPKNRTSCSRMGCIFTYNYRGSFLFFLILLLVNAQDLYPRNSYTKNSSVRFALTKKSLRLFLPRIELKPVLPTFLML